MGGVVGVAENGGNVPTPHHLTDRQHDLPQHTDHRSLLLLLLLAMPMGLYLTAVGFFFFLSFFLLSFFRRLLISEVTERISTKLGHIHL